MRDRRELLFTIFLNCSGRYDNSHALVFALRFPLRSCCRKVQRFGPVLAGLIEQNSRNSSAGLMIVLLRIGQR